MSLFLGASVVAFFELYYFVVALLAEITCKKSKKKLEITK
jgi:hypothetical protein